MIQHQQRICFKPTRGSAESEARKNSETQQEFVDELMKDEKFEKMFREMQGDEMTEADERAFQ